MSQSENNKPQNAFIAARIAGGLATQPLPPPDTLRQSAPIVVQTPPNLTGKLTCPTSSNANSKTE